MNLSKLQNDMLTSIKFVTCVNERKIDNKAFRFMSVYAKMFRDENGHMNFLQEKIYMMNSGWIVCLIK